MDMGLGGQRERRYAEAHLQKQGDECRVRGSCRVWGDLKTRIYLLGVRCVIVRGALGFLLYMQQPLGELVCYVVCALCSDELHRRLCLWVVAKPTVMAVGRRAHAAPVGVEDGRNIAHGLGDPQLSW